MADGFLQGIFGSTDNAAQIRNEITVVAINWFPNRCPLSTRVPRVPIGSSTFTMVNRSYRPRVVTCAATINSSATTLTLADVSSLMVGDILQTPGGESIEVTGSIVTGSTNTCTIARGVEVTTAAAITSADVLRLVGNSRTGAEVNQDGVGWKPVSIPQWTQTFQHPVQVGGKLNSETAFVTQPGIQTPLEQYKMDALQNLMDDIEVSTYIGKGGDPAVEGTGRAKQKGLRTLITSNKVTAPVSAGAYKPSDLIRDTLEKCRTGGGNPNMFVMSTNFMSGLATWGMAVTRIDAGTTLFGNAFDVFEAPFLGGVQIVEAPLLAPFTCITLTKEEIRMRVKRNEFWNARGVRGDAVEADWMAEMAIELDNQAHHGWLEGITAFSAT